MKSLKFLPIATAVFGLFGVCGAFENPANTKNFLSSTPPPNISFKHISTEDGLTGNRVFDIIQDRQGFMWFATRSGLNRYDGVEVVTYKYRKDDASSLSNNYAWALMEDSRGYLWVGTAGGGLNRFDPKTETFRQFKHEPMAPNELHSDSIWDIAEDSEGRVWASVIGGGLEFYDINTGEARFFNHDPDDPDSLGYDTPSALKFDSKGRFWVGTYGGGFDLFDPKTGKAIHFRREADNPNSLINDFVWDVEEDLNGFLWFGTDNGLSRFDAKTGTFKNYYPNGPEGLPAIQITDIYVDDKGFLWIGSRNSGLVVYDPKTDRFRRYVNDSNSTDQLSSNELFKIFRDSNGGYWVATGNGVNYFSPRLWQFEHFNIRRKSKIETGLSDNNVWAFYEDAQGKVWIGTREGGLDLYDPRTGRFENFRHDPDDPSSLSSNSITAIAADSTGTLWLGTKNGLDAFSPTSGTVTRYGGSPKYGDSLGSKTIRALAIDERDRIWVATYGDGLIRFNPATGELKKFKNNRNDPNTLSQDLVGDVFIDRSGRVWAATEFGLNRIDPQTDAVTRFNRDENNPGSLSSDLVNTIYEDSKGGIWVGTDEDLCLYDEKTNTFSHYLTGNGLPGNLIHEIIEDNSGKLWLITSKGLANFTPGSDKPPQYYGNLKGVQGVLFETRAVLKAHDGTLYFGGHNGFYRFDPDKITYNAFKPPVVITDIRLFNKSIPISKASPLRASPRTASKITLTHDQSIVSFTFTALDYNAPSKILYKYILEGFDLDWVQTDSRHRIATYTNLYPGKYKFKVQATNSEGIWSDKEASISVVVLPPWYGTLWFRAGIVGLVILTILFWYRSWWQIVQEGERVGRILQLAAIIPTVFIIAVLWEFVFEEVIFFSSFFNLNPDIASSKWEEVFTATFAAAISLVVPIFLIFKSDIARREIEAQLQEAVTAAEKANKAKSAFLANISHEIRTPLTGLLGTSRLLGKTPLNEKQRDLLQTVNSSGEVLLGLLNDVLDISRIESGRLSLEHVSFDLKALIEQVGQAMSGNARRKGLELIVDIADLPERVYGDPARIQQIMFNLLSNAVKFTEQGQITLAVSRKGEVDRKSGNDNLVSARFTITDAGIGIAAENIGKLFSPFTQEDDSTARRYGGSGLGLSICKSLIEAMGGEIGVDSTQGEGSTFWFVLDLELCRDFSDVPSNTNTLTPPALSILLVDDVSETRQVVSMMLEEGGHRVALADSGHAAIEAVLRDRFDLILMDVRMPDMDGMAATEAIRRLPESEGGKTPVFAFTADVVKNSLEVFKTSGMEGVVTKPLRMDEFNKTVMDHFCPNGARSPVKTGPCPPVSVKPGGDDVNLLELSSIYEYQQMMNEEKLRDLLSRYRTNSRQMVEKILSGKKRGDMAAIASNAHKLAGAAGSIGCTALNTQAKHVQKIAESGNTETLENALSRLMEIQNKSLLALDAVFSDRITST